MSPRAATRVAIGAIMMVHLLGAAAALGRPHAGAMVGASLFAALVGVAMVGKLRRAVGLRDREVGPSSTERG